MKTLDTSKQLNVADKALLVDIIIDCIKRLDKTDADKSLFLSLEYIALIEKVKALETA